jgi:hypothetical protein
MEFGNYFPSSDKKLRGAPTRVRQNVCAEPIEMRTFMIAAIIAVLAAPAHAQMGHSKGGGGGGGGGKLGKKSDEQIAAEQQKKKKEESAYKDALKKIPDQVKPTDPWTSMR